MTDAATPIAGWYPDPENAGGERWWNGTSWSDQKRPVPPAPAAIIPTATAGDARPDPYAPPPPVQPYYGATLPYGSRPPSSINGMALAGVLVSSVGWLIVSILGPIAGIVLSLVGLQQAKVREAQGIPNSGRGMAIAGIVVGGAILLLGVLVVVLLIAVSYSSALR